MNTEEQKRNRALQSVMLALAAWGVLLGFGTFLGLDPQTPNYDLRRALVVLSAVALPLIMWGLALRGHAQRQKQRKEVEKRRF